MLNKSRGIVFRSMKYSETSVICDIYTEENGLNSFIVSGVRKKKSKIAPGLLQIMSLVDIVAYFGEKKKLYRIKEIKSAKVYQEIPFNIFKSAVGQFITEISRSCVKESEKNKVLFEFLFESFVYLDQTKHSLKLFHHSFMLQLSRFVGIEPNYNYSPNTPFFNIKEGQFEEKKDSLDSLDLENSIFMHTLMKTPIESSHLLDIPKSNRQILLNHLIQFYQYHIENFNTIQSHKILHEVLES
ncbi:MAG: DNA repair protein RecO [Bacteroidota bacterium]